MSTWSHGYVADVGYTYGYYPEMAPHHAALALTLKGVRSILDPTKPFNYCELGFGQGLGLALMAAAHPHAQFYGTDFNPGHAAGAQHLAQVGGLENLHVFDQSFAEFLEADLPDFDMIALHGVYSWVSAEVRAQIVAFLRKKLKVGGVVYISYNSAPGWAATRPLRDLLYQVSQREQGDGAERMTKSLAYMNRIFNTQSTFIDQNPALRHRLEQLSKGDPRYQAHEYLNESWNLFQFSEIAQDMDEAKLTHAGPATLLHHIDALCHPPAALALLQEQRDPTLRETLRDYLLCTQFRKDLFVKGPHPLSPSEQQEHLGEERFILQLPVEELKLTHTFPIGEVTLDSELYQALATAMADAPRSLRELMEVPRLAQEGPARLLQAVLVLCTTGQATPTLGTAGQAVRIASCERLNRAITRASRSVDTFQYQLSPLTGHALGVARGIQHLLEALRDQHPDPALYAAELMFQTGQRLTQNGKTMDTLEDTHKAFGEIFSVFSTSQLPMFQRFAII